MNQLMVDLWPYIISSILVGIAAWMTNLMKSNHNIFSKQAVLEERLCKTEENISRLEKRLDHKTEEFENIQKEVEGVRNDLAEIKGDIKALTTELKTSMDFLKGDKVE